MPSVRPAPEPREYVHGGGVVASSHSAFTDPAQDPVDLGGVDQLVDVRTRTDGTEPSRGVCESVASARGPAPLRGPAFG